MAFTSQFTMPEILSLLGLVQSVYLLVYMMFRSGNIRNSIIPALYFIFMGGAFFFDAAAAKWSPVVDRYELYQWLCWFAGIPLGALLIFQIAEITQPPRSKYFLLLLLIPIAFLPLYLTDEESILYVFGLVIGSLALLAIWLRRDLLDGLMANTKFGKERFWLILALIGVNTAFLGSTLAYVSQWMSMQEWMLVRTLLGIAFVYIAGTSLFRIYPQILRPDKIPPGPLKSEDQIILEKLERLLEEEKLYQEATLGRAELARELQTGEANLSRLINIHYGKTLPQLLNEYRVKDAQRMLKETDASIQNIFEESGFNSITTFNRVFKELAGDSPKEYRARFRL